MHGSNCLDHAALFLVQPHCTDGPPNVEHIDSRIPLGNLTNPQWHLPGFPVQYMYIGPMKHKLHSYSISYRGPSFSVSGQVLELTNFWLAVLIPTNPIGAQCRLERCTDYATERELLGLCAGDSVHGRAGVLPWQGPFADSGPHSPTYA